jgi:hypothetical protein
MGGSNRGDVHDTQINDRCRSNNRPHVLTSRFWAARAAGHGPGSQAMLDQAVAAVKADRDVALAMFNKGEGQNLGRKERRRSCLCSGWHGWKNAQRPHRQGVWAGSLRCGR